MRRLRSSPPVLQGVRRWSQRAWQWLQEEKRVVHMVCGGEDGEDGWDVAIVDEG